MTLDDLFNEDNKCSSKCNGCTILSKPLPRHTILDYQEIPEADILFLSDSLKMEHGDYVPFKSQELRLFKSILEKNGFEFNKCEFAASVKCPNITDKTISAKDRKICRAHLIDTINKIKPKLVFPCGKLATTMVFGKQLDEKKGQGKTNTLTLGDVTFQCIPIQHPWIVLSEPTNRYLFTKNIVNGINNVIYGKNTEYSNKYIVIDSSIEDLREYFSYILQAKWVSVDIETTGLNFLEDSINTIALSYYNDQELVTVAIPWDHKKAQTSYKFRALLQEFISKLFSNSNGKVLQKCKFDLKFLKKYGVETFNNIWDTKIMQHLVNENVPKDLRSLVSYYFPEEL
jgi:uracil-DNA glycosylase family 4